MAVKRYPVKYVKSYTYVDEDTKEEEVIAFMANANLFPVFKSFVGKELGDCLEEYRNSILKALDKESIEVITKIESAKDVDEKLEILLENKESVSALFNTALTQDENGLTFLECILICTRVCALPEGDRAEALAIGYELLPDEIYQDPTFALDILNMAMTYEQKVKKKLIYKV